MLKLLKKKKRFKKRVVKRRKEIQVIRDYRANILKNNRSSGNQTYAKTLRQQFKNIDKSWENIKYNGFYCSDCFAESINFNKESPDIKLNKFTELNGKFDIDIDKKQVTYVNINKLKLYYEKTHPAYFAYHNSNQVIEGASNSTQFLNEYSIKISVRPGKAFKAIFPEYNNEQIEELVHKFTNYIKPPKIVEERGKAQYIYHEDNYYNGSGSLGHSCMRYGGACNDEIEFYDLAGVSILVVYINGLVTARALLWHNIEVTGFKDGRTEYVSYMDRVYTNNFIHQNAFVKYAKDHGYLNYNDGLCNAFKNEPNLSFAYKTEVNRNSFYEVNEALPYFDSFSSGVDKQGNFILRMYN